MAVDSEEKFNIFDSDCRTFRLAVGAVLVVVLSQHFGQDGLVLLVEFLSLLSLRAGRHIHSFSGTSLLKRTLLQLVFNRNKFLIKDHNQRDECLRVSYENTRNRNPLSAYRHSNADEAASADWITALTSHDAKFLMN